MKKTLTMLFCALMLALTHSTLHGETRVPANRNLFDPELFVIDTEDPTKGSLMSETPIRLPKPGDYTLSFDTGVGTDAKLKAYGDDPDTPYVDESLSDPGGVCSDSSYNYWACTFEATDEPLHIEISGGQELSMHLAFAQTDSFQLEEGTERSEYVKFEAYEDSPPEILGDEDLYVSYTSNLPLMTILEDNIEVHDEIDGEIPTDAIHVAHDAYTGNETSVGAYTATLEATDDAGNTSSFDLNIHVFDMVAPEIEGPKTLAVDVDEALTLEAIIDEHFTFDDEHDGAIDDYAIVDDGYSGSMDVLGAKAVTLNITDSSGNETSREISITTFDEKGPTIHGDASLTVYQSDMPTLASILSAYTIEDNHTPLDDVATTIESKTYTTDASSGTHTVTIAATDASDNETTLEVALEVVDDIDPTLLGKSFNRISYMETFDLEGYIESMQIHDNDDTTLDHDAIVNTDHDYVDGVPGHYTYDFVATDASGNQASHTLAVEVVDDVAPTFKTVASVLVEKDAPMSEDAIQAMMMHDPALQAFNPVSYEVLSDEYKDHREEAGSYLYTAEYSNKDGETMTRSIELQVVEIEKDPPVQLSSLVGALSVLALAGFAAWRVKRP